MFNNLYSILDKKAGVYGKPFESTNDNTAARMLHSAANDPQIQISMYPEDFDLFHLGAYDADTGRLITLDVPKFICGAASFKKIQQGETDLVTKLESPKKK